MSTGPSKPLLLLQQPKQQTPSSPGMGQFGGVRLGSGGELEVGAMSPNAGSLFARQQRQCVNPGYTPVSKRHRVSFGSSLPVVGILGL